MRPLPTACARVASLVLGVVVAGGLLVAVSEDGLETVKELLGAEPVGRMVEAKGIRIASGD